MLGPCRSNRVAGILVAGTLALVGLAGCSGPADSAKAPTPPATAGDTVPERRIVAHDNTVAAQTVSRKRLQKSFKQAVLLDPPDDGQLCMPGRTAAGKNVAQIFEAIAGKGYAGGLWDQVDFFDAQGRLLKYTAVLQTDLGAIEIELLPEAAPNHVTNFIALARAGYYDGLPFHASQRSRDADQTRAYLEAGCPKGTGEAGYGSVGYWLAPEIADDCIHVAGSVGAWHVPNHPDTAACRFYITLDRTPGMDGAYTIFGKVTRGLDVANAINQRPVVDEPPFDQPKEPVVIRHVAIHSTPGG